MSERDQRPTPRGDDEAVDGIAQLLGLGLVTPAEVAGVRPDELDCLVALIGQAQERRAFEELLTLARGLVVLSPFDVRGWLAAASALDALGDRGLAQAASERAQALSGAKMPASTAAPDTAERPSELSGTSVTAPASAPEPAPEPEPPLLAQPHQGASVPPAPQVPVSRAKAPLEDRFVTSWQSEPVFTNRAGKELPDPERLPSWSTAVTSPALAPIGNDEETTQPYVVVARPDGQTKARREPTITAVVPRPRGPGDARTQPEVSRPRDATDSFEYITRPEPMLRETGTTAVVRRRQRLPLVDFLDAALGRDD